MNIRKGFISAIAVLAIALPLAGCEPTEKTATVSSSTTTAQTVTQRPVDTVVTETTAPADDSAGDDYADSMYFAILDKYDIEYNRDGAKQVARSICDNFSEGYTTDEVIYIWYTANKENGSTYTDYQIGVLIGAATNIYCPQYAQ